MRRHGNRRRMGQLWGSALRATGGCGAVKQLLDRWVCCAGCTQPDDAISEWCVGDGYGLSGGVLDVPPREGCERRERAIRSNTLMAPQSS